MSEYAATSIYGGPDGVPGGIDPTPFATGPMLPAAADERGFKDTVKANPGYVVEHEDNDMMRPFTVVA
jgi:hypothetical protein